MNLDTTTKELQIVLGEAAATNNCNVVTAYADYLPPSTFTFGNNNANTNGTTPVVVVAAPTNGAQRQVKEVRLFNNDTVTHTVTLQLYDGTDTWIIGPSALTVGPDGSFVYTPETGAAVAPGPVAGTGASGLTATGTNQAGAFPLAATINVFSTVPVNSGAKLPEGYSSVTPIEVLNRGANPENVYPFLGDQIETYGVNVAVQVAAGGNASFACFDPVSQSQPRTWWLV
jgi:hypothetical protein